MSTVSGVFLLASLFMLVDLIALPIDPAWMTIFISGTPLLYLALTRLVIQHQISSALLISMAMGASIAIGEIFAAGEVAFIMAIGAILEGRTVARARKGIRDLVARAPLKGRRISCGGGEMIVPVEEIEIGERLRILPGECIPVDGRIIAGNTSIDQSVMTGESLPVDKELGDDVFSGTINRFGSIDIEVTKIGENSSLQKLIRMVREAEKNKAPMQRIVDKWAAWLVPIALAIAIAAYFGTGDIIRAVTVLVVFCPCALALATPTSIIAAIGQATRQGVIVKSGQALEAMGKAEVIAFDKTGTLTNGALEVCDVLSFDPDISSDALLQLAASVESRSEHPLGKAIVAQANLQGIALLSSDDFKMMPGRGIRARIGDRRMLCGSHAWLQENGVEIAGDVMAILQKLREQGKAIVLVASAGKVMGAVALADSLRETATGIVSELKRMHMDVVLLTGDHAQTAHYFASRTGIENVYSELSPEQKMKYIREFRSQGRGVCMVGDGVNDAPALKMADVGVAMGGMGSDMALDAADIALMGDDIAKIPYLKDLSNVTIRTIKFNITLSMVINFVAVGLSVAGLLTPVTGALVHNAGSVLVVLNAALLHDRRRMVRQEVPPAPVSDHLNSRAVGRRVATD